jgi:hypothetical protein
MADPNAAFADARKLEDMKLGQLMSEAAAESAQKIRASDSILAAKGLARHPAQFKAELDIIFASVEAFIDKAVVLRAELGAKVPALLEPGSMKSFKEKLERHVDGAINGSDNAPLSAREA